MDERELEAVVLTGGGSRRMGRPKEGLVLGGETLLERMLRLAREAGFAARVIREDAVPSCGPLGGVYTALRDSDADGVLFLCVDMPFMMPATLVGIAEAWLRARTPVFTRIDDRFGFPFIVPTDGAGRALSAIEAGAYSLQAFARSLDAAPYGDVSVGECFNVNTPGDWEAAQAHWKSERV